MKLKNVILGVALLVASMSFGQEKGDMSGFAGVTYPLYTGANAGATVGIEYMFSDEIGVVPSFTYYFTPSGFTRYDIGGDLRYYLGGSDSLKYYGLGGFVYRLASVDILGTTVSANGTGFSAGGGLIYSMGESFGVIAQVKYGTAGVGGIEPMVGFSFNF